jgi:hypothetical protein
MKHTMIDGNKDGTMTLYCYFNDQVVHERVCKTLGEAKQYSELFLNGNLDMA